MSSPIESRVTKARADLESALDEIEDKLNVPKRVNELTTKAKASYDTNPLPWIIGAVTLAVAVAGVIAWAILSDDE